jgi:hypothetical protein
MHPLYGEVLSRERHSDLLRQAEHDRLISTIERQRRHQLHLHRWWAYKIGHNLVKWGRQLERIGTSPTPSAPRRY